jgi:hypothetical protein
MAFRWLWWVRWIFFTILWLTLRLFNIRLWLLIFFRLLITFVLFGVFLFMLLLFNNIVSTIWIYRRSIKIILCLIQFSHNLLIFYL